MLHSLPCPLPRDAALLVIDLQKAIDDPSWGVRNNADAERNITTLLQAWRRSSRPIYHIRHDSTEAGSHYRPGQAGHEFKPEAQPLDGEVVIAKRTNNAIIGTDLEARLRAARQTVLVTAGVTTNNSVEATVRMAGNLGFDTFLVEEGFHLCAKRLEWPAPDSRGSSRHESCQPGRRILHSNANRGSPRGNGRSECLMHSKSLPIQDRGRSRGASISVRTAALRPTRFWNGRRLTQNPIRARPDRRAARFSCSRSPAIPASQTRRRNRDTGHPSRKALLQAVRIPAR